MAELAQWLTTLPLSQVLRRMAWLFPLLQTVHILSIAMMLSSVIMISLRLWGVSRAQAIAALGHRYMPWIWTSLVVVTVWGGVNEVARRVGEGETADVVMLPAPQIDGLIKQGKLIPETRVDVATSGVGVAIRSGAPKIDISSAEGIKKALLAAKTIAYSGGPSGVHIENLIKKWGLADQLKSKIVPPRPNVPIGVVVANGDAEIGFQQVSELLPVKGIDYLGPLPPDIQEVTVFSAGVHKAATAPDAGRALLKYLTAPEAAPIIRKTGMEPR